MKRLMIYSAMACLGLTLGGCKEDIEDNVPPTGVVVIQNVNVRVKNTQGIDLLNPENTNGIKTFKIYYLVGGEKKLYSNANLDASGGYRLLKHPVNGYYYLQVLMDGGHNATETKTLLQLGDDVELDTIRTKYNSDPTNVIPEKIWHNKKLVWQTADGEPTFEIVYP
ncbi:hypothetical protein [Dyadobacter sp. 22481]|uniref:hypothetical protein n=1 Tax=Dyadobacter sp. 22481 TaxID=3453926 RepID=UPI003F838562